jgi:hypothetical protein
MVRSALIGLGLLLAAAAFAAAPSTWFVANDGQWEGDFSFRLEAGCAAFFMTPTGMMIDLHTVEPSSRGGAMERRRGASPEAPGAEDTHRGGLWRVPTAFGEASATRTVTGHALRLTFDGSNPVVWNGVETLSHYSNCFGGDKCRWRSRVSHYQKL